MFWLKRFLKSSYDEVEISQGVTKMARRFKKGLGLALVSFLRQKRLKKVDHYLFNKSSGYRYRWFMWYDHYFGDVV